ncbi:MAG TPA: ABC transporter permease [Acidimicrobiales bacterium]|nr:ABC transporter permease [Acidimicrobiales bacterium]
MRLVLRKILQLIPVLLIVSVLTFLLLNLLPGDPVISILGPGATQHAVDQLRHQLHLDQPIYIRYWDWLTAALHGNFGKSYLNGQPASTAIAQHFPVTLELLALSQVIALAIAIPLGVYSAQRPNGLVDQLSTSGAFAMLAIPPFMLGVLLVFVFAVHWHVFPATGYTNLTANPAENLRSLFLPALTLGLASLAVYVRVLRADMIATLQEDYITMARAKGMSGRRILWRHAFRPSTFSLATVVGLNVGALVGGAFIVESIFAVPGIGLLTLDSIFQRDYLVVQACVLIVAVGYVFVNFLVDLLYPLLDPRTRHARAAV